MFHVIEYLHFHFHLLVHFKQNVTVKSHSHPAETSNGRLVISLKHFLQWLVGWTPDRMVRVQALARTCVLGQDTLLSSVPLSTRLYKWVPANLLRGVTLLTVVTLSALRTTPSPQIPPKGGR